MWEESYTVPVQGVLSYKYKMREAMVVIVRSTSTTNSAVLLHVPLSPVHRTEVARLATL
jgi:hypothetical protein